MESNIGFAGNHVPGNTSDVHHTGGMGIFQLLVLGLTAFTVLMALIAILMSLFMNIGS